jgi:hypothetical protein
MKLKLSVTALLKTARCSRYIYNLCVFCIDGKIKRRKLKWAENLARIVRHQNYEEERDERASASHVTV